MLIIKAFLSGSLMLALFLHVCLVMRVAISYWQNCIAPVFDVSENMLLLDIVNNQVTRSVYTNLDSGLPFVRAKNLSEWDIDVLLCGAISQTSRMAIAGQNIKIISYVFGSWEDTLLLFINGQLDHGYDDIMPVCKNGRHRKRRRNRRR